jgi:hypothetical protein
VLVRHSSATAAQCPAGRVLHANGKKLIPDVNVMNSFTVGATVQAKKFMLGVYDPESMLNGFIDPTSPTFAVYDKNRPASDYLLYATGNTDEATALIGLGGQGSRLPAKVLVGNPSTALAAGASSVGKFTAATGVMNAGSTATLGTVATTSVTADSVILLTPGFPTVGATLVGTFVLSVGVIIPETSFEVKVTNIAGASQLNATIPVNWLIVN